MFLWRGDVRPGLHVAFTDVGAGNLSLSVGDRATAAASRERLERFIGVPEGGLRFMSQIHSNIVAETGGSAGPGRAGGPPEADALVSPDGTEPLAVLVADCVPVVLADPNGRATAVVHAGRKGVQLGIVANAVGRLRARGAGDLAAWIGPAVCGACYEVPQDMADEVSALVPAARSTTRRGTAGLDLPAAVRAQLQAEGVVVESPIPAAADCTVENAKLYSHRREPGAGRIAGLVWRS